jgi:hypothetical protein
MLSYSFTHSNVCIKIIDRILHEFQSKVLKEEWEEHQKYMIAKKDKRRLEEFHAQEKLDQDIKSFRQQNSVREGHLDNLMDDLQAKFSDINTALQFDVNRIDRKLVSITFKGETEAACLGQRTNVALCFKSKAGDKCDEYIKALEKCFGDAVVLKKL